MTTGKLSDNAITHAGHTFTGIALHIFLGIHPAKTALLLLVALAGSGALTPTPTNAADVIAKSPSPPVAHSSELTRFSEEAESGMVSFNLGEEIVGPIALTVGSLGSRKQLVLPQGRWIALAARDEKVPLPNGVQAGVSSQFFQVRVTTASFGRFERGRLVSLMRFTFTGQPVGSISFGGLTSLEGCDAAGDFKLQTSRPSASGIRSECQTQAFDSNPLSNDSAATLEARQSLTRLNAAVSGPALMSVLAFTEKRRGFEGIVRFDWPGTWMGDDGQTRRAWRPENMDEQKEAVSNTLWAWWSDYRKIASDGYENSSSVESDGSPDFNPKRLQRDE